MVAGRILSFVLIVLSYGALGWLSGRSQVEWRNVVGHRVVLSMYGTDGNTVPLSTQRIRRMQEIVTLQEKVFPQRYTRLIAAWTRCMPMT